MTTTDRAGDVATPLQPPASPAKPHPPAATPGPGSHGLPSAPARGRTADGADALPGEATPWEGASPGGAHRCTCGHDEVWHDLPQRKAGRVRTRCSWHDPQPCGCPLYQEAA